MSDLKREFGKRLEELLDLEGIRKRKFALDIGISEQSLTKYLAGRIPADPEILVKMAGYFGKSIDFLLTGRSPWTPQAPRPGVLVEGQRVMEKTEKYEAIKELAGADDATVRRIHAILEADRKMIEERKKKGKKAG